MPHSLVLPPKEEDKEVKEKGLLSINKGSLIYMFSHLEIYKVPALEFTDVFKEFCTSSFLRTYESINILQKVREECNSLQDYEFFKLDVPNSPYKIEDFNAEQETSTHNTVNKLK